MTSHKSHKCRQTTNNLPFALITADDLVNCVPTKCVPLEHNVKPIPNRSISDLKRNDAVRGKPYTQESPLQFRNRYQILRSLTETDQHGHHFNSQLEGNKNKTGQKLGQKPCYNPAPGVTNSTALKGNKNKTGNKLRQGTQEPGNNGTVGHTRHQTIDFRGNKNKPGAKLGQVLHLSAHSNQSDTGIQQQEAVTYTGPYSAEV